MNLAPISRNETIPLWEGIRRHISQRFPGYLVLMESALIWGHTEQTIGLHALHEPAISSGSKVLRHWGSSSRKPD